jgi:hypothetical protein
MCQESQALKHQDIDKRNRGDTPLQGPLALYSDRIHTVPYIPETFDRVLRNLYFN